MRITYQFCQTRQRHQEIRHSTLETFRVFDDDNESHFLFLYSILLHRFPFFFSTSLLAFVFSALFRLVRIKWCNALSPWLTCGWVKGVGGLCGVGIRLKGLI